MIPDLIVSLAVVSNDVDLDATWQLLRKFGGDYEAIADPDFADRMCLTFQRIGCFFSSSKAPESWRNSARTMSDATFG